MCLAEGDQYYKTILTDAKKIDERVLKLYFEYIKKYKALMSKQIYGEKYLFGSVAIRIDKNRFITTIRGKQNFNDYTVVSKVDHKKHLVYVEDRKVT